jgi:hypothetical protein
VRINSSSDIIRTIKSRRLMWAGHKGARGDEKLFRISVSEYERIVQLIEQSVGGRTIFKLALKK